MLYPNPQKFDHLKCFFVHVCKTGGTSIERTLASPGQTVGGHSTASAMRHKWPKEWAEYFTFGVVRDPVDRFLSAYAYLMEQPTHPALMNDRVKECASLDAFVERFGNDKVLQNIVHFMPQSAFLCDRHGEVIVDHLARYEDLGNEWRSICGRLGISVALPRLNASSCRPEPTEAVRRVVLLVYAQDLRLLL